MAKCFFADYDKSGKEAKIVVNFTCLCAFGRIKKWAGSVPAAHLPEMMHPIYDKNGKTGKFVVYSEKRSIWFLSNLAKIADLS